MAQIIDPRAENEIQIYATRKKIEADADIYRANELARIRRENYERKLDLQRQKRRESDICAIELVVLSCGEIALFEDGRRADGWASPTNMRNPRIRRIREFGARSADNSAIYELACEVLGKGVAIYINPAKLLGHRYLLRKMASVGISWRLKSQSFAEDLAVELIARFIAGCNDEVVAYTQYGWIASADGFQFVGEEETLWQDYLKMAK